jgi:CheY-like chemotaxis protein
VSEPKRILVVDDDRAIRMLLSDALDLEGYVVTTASNGAEALARMDGDELPDAIVLDLMMPVMDGRTFLQHCHAEARFAGTPVVVLSASHNLTELARELGARACMAKPFDIDVLLAVVNRLVAPIGGAPRTPG